MELHVQAIRRFDECQGENLSEMVFSRDRDEISSDILIVGCDWALKCSRYCFVPTRNKRLGAFVNRECARHVSQNPLEILNGNGLRKTKQV